mmetsp:Transcript_83113/g.258035  ORF Transcript_83113/g.258035 Transcript_83113/m.258035 type:complete len:286 (-) Transcript_83113:46-903(-)
MAEAPDETALEAEVEEEAEEEEVEAEAGGDPQAAQKKKKKKRRRRSSSSGSSSPSSRSRSRGRRRRKRSKTPRPPSPGRPKKRSRSASSSPSLTIIVPPGAPQQPRRRGLRALPAPGPAGAPAAGLKALPNIDTPGVAPAEPSGPTLAQKGMAAAAALGFDVLPKAPASKPSAPAEGLRPSINTAAPAPYGASLMPGGRICIQYLCTSKCELGSNCPEAHIIDPDEEMRVRARFKEQECHYGAQCSRPGCLFRHPGEKVEEGQFVPEGQQVALRATAQGMQLEFM